MNLRLATIFVVPFLYSSLAYGMDIPQTTKEYKDPLHKCVSFLYKERYLSCQVYKLYLLCDYDFILFHMFSRGYKDFVWEKCSCYWYTKCSSAFIKDLKHVLFLFYEYSSNKEHYKKTLALYFETLRALPGYTGITDHEIHSISKSCRRKYISLAPFVKALLTEIYESSAQFLRLSLLLQKMRSIL